MPRNVINATAAEFNARVPVGTPVLYWPVAGKPESVRALTRSEAWDLPAAYPVVKLTGKAGGVLIDHVRVDVTSLLTSLLAPQSVDAIKADDPSEVTE